MSYLRYLCLFAHSGVQHILCCVFVLFVFVLCPVSLDCPFLMSLRFSLTFIYGNKTFEDRLRTPIPNSSNQNTGYNGYRFWLHCCSSTPSKQIIVKSFINARSVVLLLLVFNGPFKATVIDQLKRIFAICRAAEARKNQPMIKGYMICFHSKVTSVAFRYHDSEI